MFPKDAQDDIKLYLANLIELSNQEQTAWMIGYTVVERNKLEAPSENPTERYLASIFAKGS
jgi:hypothetical protein